MKPVKCPNNHYYDSEKYSECPHCAKEGLLNIHKSVKVEEPVKESRESEKKHFSLFKRNNKNKEENTKISLIPKVRFLHLQILKLM